MLALFVLFAALLAVGCSGTEKTAALPDAGSATPGATPNNIEWMAEPLTGYGGWRIDGRYYYTQDGAIAAAKRVGGNHDSDHRGSLFFEASGCRDNLSGDLFCVGTQSFFWSSTPYLASGG